MISINAIIFSYYMFCEVLQIPSVTSRMETFRMESSRTVGSRGRKPESDVILDILFFFDYIDIFTYIVS